MLIERKLIGPFRIRERRPKPSGFTKYVVTNDADKDINKQFGRFSAAVRWAKSQLPRQVPTVVIDLDDKQGVSNMPVNYTLLDGEFVTHHTADVDPARVEGILGVIPTQ